MQKACSKNTLGKLIRLSTDSGTQASFLLKQLEEDYFGSWCFDSLFEMYFSFPISRAWDIFCLTSFKKAMINKNSSKGITSYCRA